MSFTYKPVDSAGGEIRLLEIQPGTILDPVRATFTTTRVDKPAPPAPFEALSYMWGDVTQKADILIHGVPLRISERLAGILRTLRRDDRPVVLWVDALCINQDDLAERGAQVQLMRLIYRSAETVRIWLDEDLDTSQPAFQKLATLEADSVIPDLGDSPDFWKPVLTILKNPYWKRVWIQQEISNAPSLAIQCKDTVLEASHLVHLLRLLEDVRHDNPLGAKWIDWGTEMPSVILPSRFGSLDPQSLSIPRGSTLSPKDLDLLYTLSNTNLLACTDDRDRIYGIMFLVKDYTEGDIRVDYSLTIPQVYAEVPRTLIEKYASSRFLLFASLDYEGTTISDRTPSWVPDWRRAHPRIGLSGELEPLFPASVPLDVTISADSTTLSARGVRVDTVLRRFQSKFDTDVLSMSVRAFVDTCREIVSFAASLSASTVSDEHKNTKHTTRDNPEDKDDTNTPQWRALVRTLAVVDNRANSSPETNEILYASASHLVRLSGMHTDTFDPATFAAGLLIGATEGILAAAKALVSFAWWTLVSYFPFVSSAGGIGLARSCAADGDEVWLIEGCERPVMLRKVPSGQGYRVVGMAYLDGVNKWEVLDGMKSLSGSRHALPGYSVERIELV